MKRLVLAMCLLAMPSVAAAGLAVQLSLSSERTLPALPVGFTVTVTNPDSSPHALPRAAVLIVTPAGAAPFLALSYNTSIVENIAPWQRGVTTVAPHDQFVFDIPVDWTLGNPAWFYDWRLNQPGSYRLQLALSEANEEQLRRLDPTTVASKLPPNSALSNEVVLTVDTPAGQDALAWQRIAAKARVSAGVWLNGADLIREIWTKYGSSTYADYAVIRLNLGDREKEIAAIEGALAVHASGPIADWKRLMIAEHERYLYGDAHGRGREVGVLASYGQRAVNMYRTVIKTTTSPFTRAVAQDALNGLVDDLNDDGIRVQ